MVRGHSCCWESNNYIARYQSVHNSNMCRTQVYNSKEPHLYNFRRTYSWCFYSSKATVLCYYCQDIAPISGDVPNRPVLPFMAEYIYDILHIILEKFIKKGIMEKTTSIAKLAKVDVMDKENLVHAKNVNTGFVTMIIIIDMQTKKKASDRQGFESRMSDSYFCNTLVTKLLERCPLQYPVVRYLVCLDPRYMVAKP